MKQVTNQKLNHRSSGSRDSSYCALTREEDTKDYLRSNSVNADSQFIYQSRNCRQPSFHESPTEEKTTAISSGRDVPMFAVPSESTLMSKREEVLDGNPRSGLNRQDTDNLIS